jgi:hypothetical protein
MILGWFRMRVWDLRNEHQNVRSKFQAQSADGFVSPERPLWIPDQALQLSHTVETCGQWHKMLETCGNYSTIYILYSSQNIHQYSSIFSNIHQYSSIFINIPIYSMYSHVWYLSLEPPMRCENEPWTSLDNTRSTGTDGAFNHPRKTIRASCGKNPQSFFYIIMDKEKG